MSWHLCTAWWQILTAWPRQPGFLKFFSVVWGLKIHTGCLGCQRISLSVIYTNVPCISILLHYSAGRQSVTARGWHELGNAHFSNHWTCCLSKLVQPCLWFYRKGKQEAGSGTFPPGFHRHRIYYRKHSQQQIICHTHSSFKTAFRKIFMKVWNSIRIDNVSFLGNNSPKTLQSIFK